MTTIHDTDAFTAGYIQGFQDRQVHRGRKIVEQDGTVHISVFKLGYEMGYEHAVAFVYGQDEANNIILKRLYKWY